MPPRIPKLRLPTRPLEPLREIVRGGRERLEKASSDIHSIAEDLRGNIPDTTATTQETEKAPEIEPQSRTAGTTPSVSDKDTLLYQLNHLVAVLSQLEIHLSEGCKIMGVPCDCCLVPGTVIYSNPNITSIEEPSSTQVLTHRGRKQSITQHFEREYKGPIQEINFGYTNIPLRVTPEHPILVAKDVRRRQKDRWRKSGIEDSQLQWVEAKYLGNRDFIAFPRTINGTKESEVSLDMAELLGWYIAEGSKTENRITFSLGKHETASIEHLNRLIRRVLGKEPKIYIKPTVVHICFTDKEQTKFFEQFGNGARRKHLSSLIFSLSEERKIAFLKGLISGDGHIAKFSIVYTTTSKELAYGLRRLFFNLGLLHSLEEREINKTTINGREIHPNGPRYDIRLAGDSARALADKTGIDYAGGKRTVGNHGWVTAKYVYLPVNSNREIPYDGKVYNLAVEKDESYLTVHGALHNCAKHALQARTFAMETISIAARMGKPTAIYNEIATWTPTIEAIDTPEKVESGDYDETYRKESGTASQFRKTVQSMIVELKGDNDCPGCEEMRESIRSFIEKKKEADRLSPEDKSRVLKRTEELIEG